MLLLRWLAILPLHVQISAWNSFATTPQLYTFQEFFSDAQYGPDFGYYSTGRILHADGPADNGMPSKEDTSQEWFNSYTTLPMALSPDYGHVLCDRLVTMWQAMGRPSTFVIAEFGGGTGMLARDILRRGRDAHPDFYVALARYVIGERSQALRSAQSHTAAEFVSAGKLMVVAADGRQASKIRPLFREVFGDSNPVIGCVLSNELLDEFDPVRLRLAWHRGYLPTKSRCANCKAYREAYVLHSIDPSALTAMMHVTDGPDSTAATVEEITWEGNNMFCGLLNTPSLKRAMLAVAEDVNDVERQWCAPSIVCCFPFVIAIDQALNYRHESLQPSELLRRSESDNSRDLVRLYRHHLHLTNGTVPLTKERYRELRRLAAHQGPEMEKALLVGVPSMLPGRIHSREVFLGLSPARCAELLPWMKRNAERLAATAKLRDGSAQIYEGTLSPPRTAVHLKLVLRPGEASFVAQAGELLDEGFLVTMDYGADADALAWQTLIRPNYEGIHIVDARNEFLEECTTVSYLECPGLQDLTTSVDFTEVAEAGRQLAGWKVLAYGPIFLLEFSFDRTALDLADRPGDLYSLGHLVERAGGLRSSGLQAWYRKPELDPWASFKVLIQHKGAQGSDWTLGPVSAEWPLQAAPRLFRSPSPCWRRDLSKPPLASLITTASHRAIGKGAWGTYALEAIDSASPLEAAAIVDNSSTPPPSEDEHVIDTLLQQFQALLLGSGQPLAQLLDSQHVAQQHAYADVHLALILVDYWRLLESDASLSERLRELRQIAESRRFPELYGEADFERVLGELAEFVFANNTLSGRDEHHPFVCMAARALRGRCCSSSVQSEVL